MYVRGIEVSHRWRPVSPAVAVVRRVSPTQDVLACGKSYRKESGRDRDL